MSKRREHLQGEIGLFLRQYGRKKRPGQGEPNDRQYDKSVERLVKQMDPVELDELIRDDD